MNDFLSIKEIYGSVPQVHQFPWCVGQCHMYTQCAAMHVVAGLRGYYNFSFNCQSHPEKQKEKRRVGVKV